MNKEEFLSQLRKKLSVLSQDELEERLAFYSELIDSRTADGMAEEDAVAALGPLDGIAKRIMGEIPLSQLVREKAGERKRLKPRYLVLLILCAPLLAPLLIAASAVLLALGVAAGAVLLALWAAVAGIAAGAAGCLISIIPCLKAGNPAAALFSAGAGLACAGLVILLFFALVWLTRGILLLAGRMLARFKTAFVRKED